MDRKDWVLIGCTLMLAAAIIGSAWWLHYSIESNADALLRDVEQLQR